MDRLIVERKLDSLQRRGSCFDGGRSDASFFTLPENLQFNSVGASSWLERHAPTVTLLEFSTLPDDPIPA